MSRREILRVRKSLRERFAMKVDVNGPVPLHRPDLGACHTWTASGTSGYGTISDEAGVRQYAHRAAFYLHHGRWPTPQALHECDNRLCVRWDHITEGTQANNIADMIGKGRSRAGIQQLAKTHCLRGHAFDATNTYRHGRRRHCRTCRTLVDAQRRSA